MSSREKYANVSRIIHNCEQRNATWFNLKLGKVSGSNAHKLTTPAKFETYYYELLAETITRTITEGHITEAMQWGIDNEPFAAEWYAKETEQEVKVCGFIEMDNNIMGCSPDLLVNGDGMAQIKCFSSKHHLYYRETDITKSKDQDDKKILYQMQWEMFVADKEYNDFISYDPRCKSLQGHIQRVMRDESIIDKLVNAAEEMQERIQTFLFDNDIPVMRYVPAMEAPPVDEKFWDKAAYFRA